MLISRVVDALTKEEREPLNDQKTRVPRDPGDRPSVILPWLFSAHKLNGIHAESVFRRSTAKRFARLSAPCRLHYSKNSGMVGLTRESEESKDDGQLPRT